MKNFQQNSLTLNRSMKISGASLMSLWVKNPPVMQETQETQVCSLGQDDLLEEDMATHSSIPAWKFPRTGEPGGLQSKRVCKESDMTE